MCKWWSQNKRILRIFWFLKWRGKRNLAWNKFYWSSYFLLRQACVWKHLSNNSCQLSGTVGHRLKLSNTVADSRRMGDSMESLNAFVKGWKSFQLYMMLPWESILQCLSGTQNQFGKVVVYSDSLVKVSFTLIWKKHHVEDLTIISDKCLLPVRVALSN